MIDEMSVRCCIRSKQIKKFTSYELPDLIQFAHYYMPK